MDSWKNDFLLCAMGLLGCSLWEDGDGIEVGMWGYIHKYIHTTLLTYTDALYITSHEVSTL